MTNIIVYLGYPHNTETINTGIHIRSTHSSGTISETADS